MANLVNCHKIDVLDYFLDRQMNMDQLAAKVGAPVADIESIFADAAGEIGNATRTERRLKKIYIRERIKDLFRWSPYMGPEKICERLGIDHDTYQTSYQDLLDLGEVRFEVDKPDWLTEAEGSGIRRHIVVK